MKDTILSEINIHYSRKLENAMNKEDGFTLVELVATMVILTIVMATAVPNFTLWKNNYQIRSESERVHMDMMLARMTAIKNNNNVVMTIVAVANTYSILDDTNNNGTADAGETLKTRTLENDVVFGFYGPSITDMDNNSVTETVLMGGTDTVTWDPRGQADLSGVLFLIHSSHLTVGNSKLRGINVIQATGSAELWHYNSAISPIPWE
jgi:prepilin-type N-terminal cleavage/methylation domain-containing protein